MKKTFIIWLLLFSTNLFSQSDIYNKSITNLNAVGTVNPNTVGAVGFDNRYEGIKGSPFLFSEYKKAIIVLEQNKKVENIFVNLDNYKNNVFYKLPNSNKIFIINNALIKEVLIVENKQTFTKLPSTLFNDYVKENSLFQLLKQDTNVVIVKLTKVSFKKANFEGAYSSDIRYDEFQKKQVYFIKMNSDKFEMIKPTKKYFYKHFPDKKNIIKNMFKEKGGQPIDDNFIISIYSKLQ